MRRPPYGRWAGALRTAVALAIVSTLAAPVDGTIRVRDPGGLNAETAALILSGQQGGDLAMEAVAVPLASSGGEGTVGVFVEIAGPDLLFDQEAEELRIEFLVYAIAGGASVKGYVLQAFELDLDRYGEALAAGGFRFNGRLDLPPGDYSLAVLARSPKETFQSMGLRRVAVSVPAENPGSRVFPPRFATAEEAWVEAFQVMPESARAENEAARRELLERAAPFAAAKPVLLAGSPAEVRVPVMGSERAPESLSIEYLDTAVQVLGESAIANLRGEAGASAGAGKEPLLVAGTIIPPDLAPGSYSVRSRLEGLGGEPQYSPAVPVIVVGGAAPESWVATIDREAPQAPVAGIPRTQARKRVKVKAKDVQALEQRYAAILELAAGAPDAEAATAAAVAAAEFEQQAVAEFGDRALQSLVAAEMGLIRALGKESTDALIPVARLHQEVYREHRSKRAFLLATHARNLSLAVIDLYIDGGNVDESERLLALRSKDERLPVAARLLASFGGDLQGSGLRRFSERLFRRALECDDRNEAALMGLGASFEKYSEYAEAANYFERLVDAWPENGEGRLRLGINLLRHGRRAKAVEHLEAAARGDFERWIQVLALQELAQVHLAAEDYESAGEVLARATERFPNEPKFYLQLALMGNATGQPWLARNHLDRLAEITEPAGDSPRYVYSNWPADSLARVWAHSDEDVESRRSALASVLPKTEGSSAP